MLGSNVCNQILGFQQCSHLRQLQNASDSFSLCLFFFDSFSCQSNSQDDKALPANSFLFRCFFCITWWFSVFYRCLALRFFLVFLLFLLVFFFFSPVHPGVLPSFLVSLLISVFIWCFKPVHQTIPEFFVFYWCLRFKHQNSKQFHQIIL